jgi:hypothetical protein
MIPKPITSDRMLATAKLSLVSSWGTRMRRSFAPWKLYQVVEFTTSPLCHS